MARRTHNSNLAASMGRWSAARAHGLGVSRSRALITVRCNVSARIVTSDAATATVFSVNVATPEPRQMPDARQCQLCQN